MSTQVTFPPSHDVFFQEGGINSGDPIGFMLARKAIARVPTPPAEPYLNWLPFWLDPAKPEDPTAGHWGVRQWRLKLAIINSLSTYPGRLDDQGDAEALKAHLLNFLSLSKFEFRDVDLITYSVRMYQYEERHVEPNVAGNKWGGWLITVSLAEVET